jgi:cytochrome c peroxidase
MKIWHAKTANFKQVRQDIEDILDDPDYDDGSFGPVLIRLAWHSSGTYSAFDKNGGSNGANMRHAPEKDHGANAGLDVAREKLESIKKKHPEISYADLYILASIVAIEAMGGPKISFRPGRTDTKDNKLCTPDGRLPDASKGRDHIRAIFYRMGLNDEEMVALIGGGHAIGRCHTDRSGFSGPWTNSPTMFTNDFFVQLLENEWSEKKWDGPTQYEDKSGELMMLPTDLELRDDPIFRKHSEKFAEDEDYFFEVFAKAYEKLVNMGCDDILCPRAV